MKADADNNGIYSENELNALTVAELKALATEKSYTITATKKADIIAEIISQQ